MAKRNCRMTDEERATHDRAVSIRKMTDKQLCEFIDRQYSNGMNEGLRVSREEKKPCNEVEIVEKFISYLEKKIGSGNGIGGGTTYRLRKEVLNAATEGILGGSA